MKFNNPHIGKEPGTIRDPYIVLIEDTYYLVGTSPAYWEGYTPGVRMWSSKDLIDWKFEGVVWSADDMGEDDWCKNRFWAPELFAYKGKYYITASCRNEKNGTPFGMFLAVADCVTGPYQMASKEPIHANGIDAHFFLDDDGEVYFFCGGDLLCNGQNGIYMGKFDMENLCLKEPLHMAIPKGTEGEWDSIGIEGPAVVKRDGIYYLWYSSWTRGYEMGWATTDDLRKPFTKWPQNPVISGTCERFDAAGHNGAFRLKDGRDAISYHAHKRGEIEQMCIDLVSYPMESRTPILEIEV